MEKTKNQYSSIRKKLTAAVAMLLIAAIMVVNSTYAWFTLSTAPEVTGIKTTVGANGNLEIALAQNSNAPGASGTTDSMAVQSALLANVTWGNLVDLSDGYGLDLIKLMPAKLNLNGSTINVAYPLGIPEYGYDGRVSKIDYEKAIFGTLQSGVFQPVPTSVDPGKTLVDKGVRAIGVSMALSLQESTYNSEKVKLASSLSEARTLIITSASKNGNGLATLVAQHALVTGTDNNSYPVADIQAALKDVAEANAKIKEALGSYSVMCAASTKSNLTEEEWNTAKADAATDAGLAALAAEASADGNYKKAYELWVRINNSITSANSKIIALSGATTANWDTVSAILKELMDPDVMTVCGMTTNKIAAPAGSEDDPSTNDYDESKSGMDNFLSRVISNMGKGLDIGLPANSTPYTDSNSNGIYADFADLVGTYSASITLKDVPVKGMGTISMPATLNAASNGSALKAIVAPEKPASNPNADPTFTDTYGYAIDFWFRTNATDSSLVLQTAAANRIYASGTNEEIMGKGSNASFTSLSNDFVASDMLDLLDSMKIVFFNRTSGAVISYAKFDTAAVKNSADYDTTGKYASRVDVDIVMAYEANGTTEKTDNVIVALNKNAATAISVLVYLDGETIQNKDVANAVSSMTGNMNFQFASDANLVPMDYTPLK